MALILTLCPFAARKEARAPAPARGGLNVVLGLGFTGPERGVRGRGRRCLPPTQVAHTHLEADIASVQDCSRSSRVMKLQSNRQYEMRKGGHAMCAAQGLCDLQKRTHAHDKMSETAARAAECPSQTASRLAASL